MSELDEKAWAVISERGVEASGLSYGAALNLRRTLESERVHGLSIVTDAAARREAHQITLSNAPPRKK